jgi:hypothetical protein
MRERAQEIVDVTVPVADRGALRHLCDRRGNRVGRAAERCGMKISQPGIYRGVDSADYFADPCPEPSLSQSICKVLLERSPLKAKYEHPRLAPPTTDDEAEAEKYVKAQAIGNAAHAIMIGRGKTLEIIQFDNFKKAAMRKKLRDAAYAAGKTPILEKHFTIASDIVSAGLEKLKRHEDRDAFTNGAGEVMRSSGRKTASGAARWSTGCTTICAPSTTTRRPACRWRRMSSAFAPRRRAGTSRRRSSSAGSTSSTLLAPAAAVPLHRPGAGRQALRPDHDAHGRILADDGPQEGQAAMMLWRSAIETGRWQGYPLQATAPRISDVPREAMAGARAVGRVRKMNDNNLIMAG